MERRAGGAGKGEGIEMNVTSLSDLSGTTIALIVALIVLELGVTVFALVRLMKTPNEQLVFGKKWPWLLIILLLMNSFIGPLIFIVAGRKPAAAQDPFAVPAPDAPKTTDRAERAADVLYGGRDGE